MSDDRPVLVSTNFRWHWWLRAYHWLKGDVRLVNGPDCRRT